MTWMSVSGECCVFSGRGLCFRLITRPYFFRVHVSKLKECVVFVVIAKKEAPSNFYTPSTAASSWSERVYLL